MDGIIESLFTPNEIESLKQRPNLSDHSHSTFVKWRTVLTSQTIAGGGTIILLTNKSGLMADPFENVVEWNQSICGLCSFGCGLGIGVDHEGHAVVVRGNGKHPTNAGCNCVNSLREYKAPNNEKYPVEKRRDFKQPVLNEARY